MYPLVLRLAADSPDELLGKCEQVVIEWARVVIRPDTEETDLILIRCWDVKSCVSQDNKISPVAEHDECVLACCRESDRNRVVSLATKQGGEVNTTVVALFTDAEELEGMLSLCRLRWYVSNVDRWIIDKCVGVNSRHIASSGPLCPAF